jgi:hypothetical protein
MRRLSPREHLLLLLACAVALGTAVYFPRIRPARLRTAALQEQRARIEQEVGQVRWPRVPDDPGRLALRRDALRAEVAAAREALARAEQRFVSRADPRLADELRISISALADRHGVYFRENLACPEAALRTFVGDAPPSALPDAARLVRFLALGDPYALGARQVTLETDFAGLRGFLCDLASLDHRVLVLRFDITVGDRPGVAPLLATLVLVF